MIDEERAQTPEHAIDWLSITFTDEWSPNIALPLEGSWTYSEKGMLGYTRTATHNRTGTKLFSRPAAGGNHQHMVMSGAAIRSIEEVSEMPISKFARTWRGALRARASRIDYAVTSTGLLTPQWLWNEHRAGRVIARIGDAKYYGSEEHGLETMYMGSSKGQTKLRCYRKDVEERSKDALAIVDNNNPKTRVEMQWRGEMADRAWDIMATDIQGLRGMVLSQVKVVQQEHGSTDTNRARWPIGPIWRRLYGDGEPMTWPRGERGPDDAQHAQEWLMRSAARSMAIVAARLGSEAFTTWLYELLYTGSLQVDARLASVIETQTGQEWGEFVRGLSASVDERWAMA
jgi:hypothetical protein